MKQITFASRNHLLTNTNIWAPDSQWLTFNARPSGASLTGETTERMNIHTGGVEVIYRASQGVYVGVMTIHPKSEKYVLIHGPENPDEIWYYDSHHRRGMIVEGGEVSSLDVMDITAPYIPGALRGGSHVHVFSPNGERVSFTYSDHVMHELDLALDLWNVGVAVPFDPANVQKQHSCEYNGSHWCVLAGKTTPTPQLDNDEVDRAYEGGWVENHALVFIGDTLSPEGEKVPESSIIELPRDEADWKAAGGMPLGRTEATLPAPPYGIVQWRLIFTHHRIYPGLVNAPRHWVRCSPQGTQVASLMRDDNSIVQLWLISSQDGESRQLTHNKTDVQSAFNWYPPGEWLGFVLDNWIAYAHAQSGEAEYLTKDHANPPSADAVVSSSDGQWLAWMEDGQLWITETDR